MEMMVGFRYDPTDVELMKMLMKKVAGAERTNLNHHRFIVNDCEVYGKTPPWEIYDSLTHYHLHSFYRKLYVFTDLKTTTNGNRVCRAASCGTWLEKSKPKRIFDSQGSVIGIDRMLSFKAKDLHSGKFNKTNWIMHEFSLANQEFGRNNTVLCVIYKLKGSGSVCEEEAAIGRGLQRAFSSTADEEFSCFNTTAAMISLEPEPELAGFFSEEASTFNTTAAVISIEPEPELAGCFSEEASTFNTTGVISYGEEDAQAQEHKKRRLDAGADAFALTDEEVDAFPLTADQVDALIADLTFPDDPPPLVEVCSQSKSDPVADTDTDADFDALITELLSDFDTTGGSMV